MYFLYILRGLKDANLYIGTSVDVNQRLLQHNNGRSKSTKYRRPFELLYVEPYPSRSDAMKREWYFKNSSDGNRLMRKLIREL